VIDEPCLRPVASAPTFAARLDALGDRPAVVADDVTLTYDELARRADEVGDAIGGTRRLVLIQARNDLDSLVAYLGALRAGHAVLLTEHADGADNTDHAAYDPDVVIADGRIDNRRLEPRAPLHPDLALLLSTSGSTGSPKLVRLSHHNLDANTAAIAEYLELTPADRAMTSLPMHYCYGLSVIHSHLAAGASVVLTTLSVVDRCFWNAFNAHRATNLAGVPYTFELLDRVGFDPHALPTLRFITQAGGRMDPERVRRYARLTRLFVMYGQTEATARMAYLPPDQAAAHPDCIGVPIPGGRFDIVDDELVYHGPNVMLGYAHSRADLALGRTVDALHTGDLARRTPDGLYQIVGRRSRTAKLFGLRIDLDHLERRFDALCAGDDAGLVLAADPARHGRIRQQLDLPVSAVHLIDAAAAPRLANGKPDYAAMLATRPSAPPLVGNDVAALFARLLGVDDVRDDDTFVTLGGDSLSYVEASVALERLLGDLPPDWHTTPVGRLRQATTNAAPTAVPRVETNVVVRAAAIVLVIANHGGLFDVWGGAHVLLVVAGFNFARFQLASGRFRRSIARIVVPSVCVIGAMAALRDDYGWPHALLVNGFVGEPGARRSYWFIEALVVILVGLALLLSNARVRAVERRHPAAFATVVLAAALAVRFLPDVGYRLESPHEVLWLFVLGWLAAVTGRRAAIPLTVVAAAATYGFFNNVDREAVVVAGIVALVWLPAVRVPRPLVRPLAAVAAASLYIYVTHWAVLPWLNARVVPALATLGALAVGVVVHRVSERDVRHTLLTFARPRHTDGV